MLTPRDEAELAEAISGATGPLAIRGGGTRGISVEGEALSTAGLTGITLYEPGALTIVANAGTPVAEIEAALAAENQMLAFEPMDHRPLMGTTGEPTIGGVVATNTSGPRRVQAGACRDFLLGVRFVDGSGTVIKNGGRVMKNVTGYDLTKLMCGAHGTLGVLSEVSLKVLPRHEATATLAYSGLDWTETAAAFSAAMSSPYEVTGAARLPKGADFADRGAVLFRVSGFRDSVAYRTKQLVQRLSLDFGEPEEIETDYDRNVEIWQSVRDVGPFADDPRDIWRISLKPTECPRLASLGTIDDVVLDWAGGRAWAAVAPGTDVRARLGNFDGHATLVRGETISERFHPEAAVLARMARGLRNRYDPRSILNNGLMEANP